jgi:hypothetical protein
MRKSKGCDGRRKRWVVDKGGFDLQRTRRGAWPHIRVRRTSRATNHRTQRVRSRIQRVRFKRRSGRDAGGICESQTVMRESALVPEGRISPQILSEESGICQSKTRSLEYMCYLSKRHPACWQREWEKHCATASRGIMAASLRCHFWKRTKPIVEKNQDFVGGCTLGDRGISVFRVLHPRACFQCELHDVILY